MKKYKYECSPPKAACVVRMTPEKHKRLMTKAASEGIKIQALLEGWIDEYLKGEKK